MHFSFSLTTFLLEPLVAVLFALPNLVVTILATLSTVSLSRLSLFLGSAADRATAPGASAARCRDRRPAERADRALCAASVGGGEGEPRDVASRGTWRRGDASGTLYDILASRAV